MPHTWQHRQTCSTLWVVLNGQPNQTVRCKPCPRGNGYMWQFRKTVAYAATIEQAIALVEAGAEFFETMRRNPYA